MKLFIKILYFFTLCGLLFSAGCKKDKTPSSEWVTINGQIFGCRVNGKPFIADKWDYGNNVPPIFVTMLYSPVLRYSYLIASGDKQNEMVEIYLNPPLVIGRRNLNFRTRPYPIETVQKDYGLYLIQYPNKEFITNDTLGGYVDILFADTVTRKIEGRFEFTGTDRNTGEKVTVTNGYFKNF